MTQVFWLWASWAMRYYAMDLILHGTHRDWHQALIFHLGWPLNSIEWTCFCRSAQQSGIRIATTPYASTRTWAVQRMGGDLRMLTESVTWSARSNNQSVSITRNSHDNLHEIRSNKHEYTQSKLKSVNRKSCCPSAGVDHKREKKKKWTRGESNSRPTRITKDLISSSL